MLLVLAISYFGPPHFHLGNEYFWGPNSDPAIVGGEEEIYLLFSFLFTFLRCVVCVCWKSGQLGGVISSYCVGSKD